MKNSNNNLILYIIIVILKQIATVYFPSKLLGYLFLLILAILLCFEKKENYLPTILFFHPCSALFDNISFTYLFNVVIVIFTFKYFWDIKKTGAPLKLNKKMTIMMLLLFLYEIFLILINGYASLVIFSLISWVASYLFVLQFIGGKIEVDLNKCLFYFFAGYLSGAIGGFAFPFLKYGFDFPSKYRYMGLFRDPNVYSLDALLIVFSSLCINKKFSYITIITMLLGFLSISKMYILVLIVGLILYSFYNFKNINLKKIIAFLFLITVTIFLGIKTSLFDNIYAKYLLRIDSESLSTGRTDILNYYFNRLINNPINLLFGSSMLKYRYVLVDYSSARALYESHNTYLELILSWGILGSAFYLAFLRKIIISIKNILDSFQKDSIPLIIVFLLSIFTLDYLSADIFIIMILYITLCSFLKKNHA